MFVIMSTWSLDKKCFVTEKYFSTNSVIATQMVFRKYYNIKHQKDIPSRKVILACAEITFIKQEV